MAAGTVAILYQSVDTCIAEITYAADGDVDATTITHGLGDTPVSVHWTQRTNGFTAGGAAIGYTWTVSSTAVVVTKVSTFAGCAGVVRFTIRRVHHQGL